MLISDNVYCRLGHIAWVQAQPAPRRKMGRAGRERVERHFGVEMMVQETEILYETLLREKGVLT